VKKTNVDVRHDSHATRTAMHTGRVQCIEHREALYVILEPTAKRIRPLGTQLIVERHDPSVRLADLVRS
jgi:ferric-dicitrate binding protein FerR (iron transport regulator)